MNWTPIIGAWYSSKNFREFFFGGLHSIKKSEIHKITSSFWDFRSKSSPKNSIHSNNFMFDSSITYANGVLLAMLLFTHYTHIYMYALNVCQLIIYCLPIKEKFNCTPIAMIIIWKQIYMLCTYSSQHTYLCVCRIPYYIYIYICFHHVSLVNNTKVYDGMYRYERARVHSNHKYALRIAGLSKELHVKVFQTDVKRICV